MTVHYLTHEESALFGTALEQKFLERWLLKELQSYQHELFMTVNKSPLVSICKEIAIRSGQREQYVFSMDMGNVFTHPEIAEFSIVYGTEHREDMLQVIYKNRIVLEYKEQSGPFASKLFIRKFVPGSWVYEIERLYESLIPTIEDADEQARQVLIKELLLEE
jgi:hypothetical protein